MKITLLVDAQSWIVPHAQKLREAFIQRGHNVALVTESVDIGEGDCAFFLGYPKLVPKEVRARNTHNLVVHESALPQGKGWSPLTWQILEGKNDIPVTLFEAVDEVDAGMIYAQKTIRFEGHELIDELRVAQGEATVNLALEFIDAYPPNSGRTQTGESTEYKRRTPKDSELDPNRPLVEQFNLLRVVDNERYPAFFTHQGKTYILKISKKSDA